jgi:hypothetical protein
MPWAEPFNLQVNFMKSLRTDNAISVNEGIIDRVSLRQNQMNQRQGTNNYTYSGQIAVFSGPLKDITKNPKVK